MVSSYSCRMYDDYLPTGSVPLNTLHHISHPSGPRSAVAGLSERPFQPCCSEPDSALSFIDTYDVGSRLGNWKIRVSVKVKCHDYGGISIQLYEVCSTKNKIK